MHSRKILFFQALVLSFFTFFSAGLPAFAQSQDTGKEQYVAVRLLPEKTTVQGGETITVGIEQTIHKGWHTYWINPGDSGTATKIGWSGLDDVKAAPIQWPTPSKLPIGPLMNFGYENGVVLLQDLTLPKELPEGPITLTATVDVLVCNDICIPESHSASFTLNGSEEAVPAAIAAARSKLPLDMGWDTAITEDSGDLIVKVATDTPQVFARAKNIELYPEEWGLIANTEKATAETGDHSLTIRQKRGERALDDVPVSKIVIAYDDANGARKSIRVSTLSEAGPAATVVANDDVGIAKAIFLALLGGLILNLMPCVFPVLSMKALSLVQLKDKEIKKARLQGLAYTAGILVCFGVIASALIVLKAGGAQIGWGFQLQNPAIILLLAYLFFLIGLNLAGYFDINLPFMNWGSNLTQKNGVRAAFFTGMLATLVATPCTAPFMGVAMGYALTQPAVIALSVFFALGFGLALPYLLLTFIPAVRHLLPHPGAWMEVFRQFLAFPMFASSCWLVWVLSQQTDDMGILTALLGMLSLFFGLWVLKLHPSTSAWRGIGRILSVAAFLFAASTLAISGPADKSDKDAPVILKDADQNWENFTQAKLDDYLKDGNAVFVNMTAAWCITCKVNERVALSTPDTRQLFASKNIKYLKGDWTNQNPEITKFLESYGRSGVPIYVYYGPRSEQSGERPKAVVLPQILTPGIVADTLNH